MSNKIQLPRLSGILVQRGKLTIQSSLWQDKTTKNRRMDGHVMPPYRETL
jgi:hypothetical protein